MAEANDEITRLFKQAQADFDRLRQQSDPIKIQLVHRASNFKVEGVVGHPQIMGGHLVGIGGAGHREGRQVFDEQGRPKFRDDPILDVHGNPIANSAGDFFDFIMPATRFLSFTGDPSTFGHLKETAKRAAELIPKMTNRPAFPTLDGWQFANIDELWWGIVFEIAWAGRHPHLKANRRIWLPSEQPSVFLPYDIEKLRGLAQGEFAIGKHIPANWLKRLPDAYVSELENAAAASFDAADYILSSPDKPSTSENPEVRTSKHIDDAADLAFMRRRFGVAFSFPGEHRKTVEAVAKAVANVLTEARVFYDRFHEAELARPNLDLVLQNIYRNDSDLVVVFVCGQYSEKEWCGVEWRAIRDLIKSQKRDAEDVMFLRLDDKELDGLLSIDGYSDVSKRDVQEIAEMILRRWTLKR